jgi:hypothetical protein
MKGKSSTASVRLVGDHVLRSRPDQAHPSVSSTDADNLAVLR